MKYFILAMTLFLISCHRQLITCRTEFLNPSYLASEQIQTPDPLRKDFYGQQIVIHWSLPKPLLQPNPLIHLQIRFGDRSEEVIDIPIDQQKGWWVYLLTNDDYRSKRGILTFKADVQQEGKTLANWTHLLWVERISLFSELSVQGSRDSHLL